MWNTAGSYYYCINNAIYSHCRFWVDFLSVLFMKTQISNNLSSFSAYKCLYIFICTCKRSLLCDKVEIFADENGMYKLVLTLKG